MLGRRARRDTAVSGTVSPHDLWSSSGRAVSENKHVDMLEAQVRREGAARQAGRAADSHEIRQVLGGAACLSRLTAFPCPSCRDGRWLFRA